MTTESAPIDSLSPDPANLRLHPARNLDAIKSSLKRFGQQKPIVVDQNGIVRAGNGTLAAAKSLGWKTIDVVRTELTGSDATAFAIADNRSAELANWDDDALARQLDSLRAEGFDLTATGFDEKELTKLLDDPVEVPETLGEEKWLVVVTCKDEQDQIAFLNQMESEGRQCKALFS